MKIATTIGEMYDYVSSPADAVRCYAGSGFKYLDYSFYYDHLGNSPFLAADDRLWQKQIADAQRSAQECGFTFVQAHAPGYNPAGSGDHEACMRAMLRSIDACGMLNIPVVVMHTSFSKQHIYPADKAAYFEYNRNFLMPILRTAEKYGLTVCIENTSEKNVGCCYCPRTAAEMNDFVDFTDHPLLGCCWDTGHAVMEGKTDQYGDLCELGRNLKAVHIHDNNGLSDQHLIPYCGKLQFDRVVEALKDMDFKGYFTFEADAFMNNFNSTGAMKHLPLEIRKDALALLYKTGKFALESFGIFED